MSPRARTFAAWLALALAAAALVPAASACRGPVEDRAGATASPSLYPLDLALRDQDGRAMRLDALRGSPVVVTMFYASCPAACPLLVARVKELDAMLSPAVRARVRVLVVSFDPAHDTPEVLRETAARHHVDDRWRFATGSEEDVRVLASALEIGYRPMPGGGFAHDSVLTVLDAEGRVAARTDDPASDLRPLAAALTASAR